jgi:hypothetical protein
MSSHSLSIVVDGPGTDADHRSHWTFAIHSGNTDIGTVMQVQVIDMSKLIYQFDERRGVDIRSRGSEGSFKVASLTQEQAQQAAKIIRDEPPPRDGVERCQDWVLRAIISLEAEEVVPPGTSADIEMLVGKAATAVAEQVGDRWIKTATE